MSQWDKPGLAQNIDTYWHGDGESIFRDQVITTLTDYIQPGTILDVGCGTGLIYEKMNRVGLLNKRKYIGGDSSREMLAIARIRYPMINFVELDILSLPYKADNVLCIQVLQHLIDYKTPVIQLGKATKKLLYIVSWFNESASKDLISDLDQYGCYNSEFSISVFNEFIRKELKPTSIIWKQIDNKNWAVAIRMG